MATVDSKSDIMSSSDESHAGSASNSGSGGGGPKKLLQICGSLLAIFLMIPLILFVTVRVGNFDHSVTCHKMPLCVLLRPCQDWARSATCWA